METLNSLDLGPFSWELIVTIVGWFIVAALQIVILKKEGVLQRRLEEFRIKTPRRLLQLQECAEWVIQGNRLATEYQNSLIHKAEKQSARGAKTASTLRKDFNEWNSKSSQYMAFAYGIWDKKFKGKLANKLTAFSNEINNLFYGKRKKILEDMKHAAVEANIEEIDYMYNETLHELHYELIIELDRYADKAYELD